MSTLSGDTTPPVVPEDMTPRTYEDIELRKIRSGYDPEPHLESIRAQVKAMGKRRDQNKQPSASSSVPKQPTPVRDTPVTIDVPANSSPAFSDQSRADRLSAALHDAEQLRMLDGRGGIPLHNEAITETVVHVGANGNTQTQTIVSVPLDRDADGHRDPSNVALGHDDHGRPYTEHTIPDNDNADIPQRLPR